jgi:hypothetical protein
MVIIHANSFILIQIISLSGLNCLQLPTVRGALKDPSEMIDLFFAQVFENFAGIEKDVLTPKPQFH